MALTTFVAGDVLEAQQLNDSFAFVNATYATYTPTISGWTPGNGTTTRAVYSKTGDTVNAQGYWTFGSTSSVPASGTFQTTLPVSAIASGATIYGICTFFDLSASVQVTGLCRIQNATDMYFYWQDPETAPIATRLEGWNTSATLPFTFATGDIISWNITYQAA
jgi:hypothetical protein